MQRSKQWMAAIAIILAVSGSGGSSGIQRSPGGSNMQITTSGHWEGVVWQYNGVPYQINWMFVLDYASWSSSDNPNPYVFEAN